MRYYPLRLEKYGISEELFDELDAFCRQYKRKKKELTDIRGALPCGVGDGMPRGNGVGAPTEGQALRAIALLADLEAVEQSAIAASAELYPYIIANVTAKKGEASVRGIPSGIHQFYRARRLFYCHLAVKLGKIGRDGVILS